MTPDDQPSAPFLLEYEPTLLMLASLDAEWTRKDSNDSSHLGPLSDTFVAFSNACATHLGLPKDVLPAKGLYKSYKDWQGARKMKLTPTQEENFRAYLYRPLHFVPWAHEDNLSMVLVDDVDSPQTIVEIFPQLTEEMALAACVCSGPYVEAVIGRRLEKLVSQYGGSSADYSEVVQVSRESVVDVTAMFQQCLAAGNRWPLLLISRFKISGILSTAGASLRIQDGIFELLTEAVLALALEDLVNKGDAQSHFGSGEENDLLWGSRGAGNLNFQVSLLDLQDEEEVGLLIRCANYSHGMRILLAVQSLTLSLLWKCRPLLKVHLENCGDFNSLSKSVRELLDLPSDASALEACMAEGNHLFRWTRTTAAIDWAAYQAACNLTSPTCDQLTIEGVVHAIFRTTVNPGHLDRAHMLINQMCENARCDKIRMTNPTENPAVKLNAWWNIHLGSDDLVFNPATQILDASRPDSGSGPAFLSVCDLIRLNAERRASLASFDGNALSGRDLLAWVSSISVPVTPNSAALKLKEGTKDGAQMAYCPLLHPCGDEPAPHQAVLQHALRKAAEWLFPQRTEDFEGGFSEKRLLEATRKLGLPGQFRRSVNSLYSNFRSLLANPLVFDVAIDLYDALISFHQYLAIYLPQRFKEEQPEDEQRKLRQAPRLRPSEAEALGRYLEALEEALLLRLRHLYPEPMRRDLSVDFRGGLRQILVAGDAVLKTALGLVRNHARKHPMRETTAPYTDFTRLGVVHMLGFQQGMYAHFVKGKAQGEDPGAVLAYFESDLAHATRPASFCDIYHEAFHVAYELRRGVLDSGLQRMEVLIEPSSRSAISSQARWKEGAVDLGAKRSEYAQEIYVHLCMGLNFYHGDTALLLREHARDYSARGVNGGSNIESRFRELTRNLAPALMAACLICACRPRLNDGRQLVAQEYPEDRWLGQKLRGYLDFTASEGLPSESADNCYGFGFPHHQFPESKVVIKWFFRTFRNIALLFSDLDDACLELGECSTGRDGSPIKVRLDDGFFADHAQAAIRHLWQGLRRDLYQLYDGLKPLLPTILAEARLLHHRIIHHTVLPHFAGLEWMDNLAAGIEGDLAHFDGTGLAGIRTAWSACVQRRNLIHDQLKKAWRNTVETETPHFQPVPCWSACNGTIRFDPSLFVSTTLQAAQELVWNKNELDKLLDYPPAPRSKKVERKTHEHFRYILDRQLGAKDAGQPCFDASNNAGKEGGWNPQQAPGFQGYGEFLIDPASSRLFCAVPSARQRRVGVQLMLLKSFWDIASHTRLRRLSALLAEAAKLKQFRQKPQVTST